MIAIRVLHDSKVVRELVVAELPLTIGRGPDNAVVLADASVSRAHARIERSEEGLLRIVDLDSRNGLLLDGRRVASVALDRCLALRLGGTELQIEPVADTPTLEIPALRPEERRRGVAAWLGYLVLGVAGLLAGQLLEASFWSPWNHMRWIGLLGGAIGAAVALPLVAGVLFLVLKVIGRRVRMADTLRALGLLAWLVPATDIVLLVAYYPLSPSQFALLQLALGAATGATTVAVLASVRREPRSRTFTLAWAGTVLVFVAGFMAIAAMTSRQRGQPNVDLKLQAPLAGYAGRTESLDAYLGAVRQAATEGLPPDPSGKRSEGRPTAAGLER
jgi:uncharacterized membrane protein YeaQ/YmgE (transglycosylase-associated protein family)